MVLISSPKYRTKNGTCQYRDVCLPSLNHKAVLQHHNICVTELIELSNDPAFVQDESLLAALVILRLHEEMDTLYTGEDKERLLRSTRFFLDAQTKNSLAKIHGNVDEANPTTSADILPETTIAHFRSFRHTIFRIALRQELTAAYLTQRCVQYPITLWCLLDDLEASYEEDFIWADRHLLHCARVLDFCYGSDKRTERWKELKSFEARWEEKMPVSFLPLFQSQPGGSRDQILYRVWYISDLHLSTVQFSGLSRILLMVFDPTTPRIGPNATTARQLISAEVRRIVIHLCSTAASYPDLTPAFVQAAMAVVICGELFTSYQEQDTLITFLAHLEEKIGWPTSHHAARLKHSWTAST
jgi:hypothetical protein